MLAKKTILSTLLIFTLFSCGDNSHIRQLSSGGSVLPGSSKGPGGNNGGGNGKGCMFPEAQNYDKTATEENGKCAIKYCGSSPATDAQKELEKRIDDYKKKLQDAGITFKGSVDSNYHCSPSSKYGCTYEHADSYNASVEENGTCHFEKKCLAEGYENYDKDFKELVYLYLLMLDNKTPKIPFTGSIKYNHDNGAICGKKLGCASPEAVLFDLNHKENGSCDFRYCGMPGYENTDEDKDNAVTAYLDSLASDGITHTGSVNKNYNCGNLECTFAQLHLEIVGENPDSVKVSWDENYDGANFNTDSDQTLTTFASLQRFALINRANNACAAFKNPDKNGYSYYGINKRFYDQGAYKIEVDPSDGYECIFDSYGIGTPSVAIGSIDTVDTNNVKKLKLTCSEVATTTTTTTTTSTTTTTTSTSTTTTTLDDDDGGYPGAEEGTKIMVIRVDNARNACETDLILNFQSKNKSYKSKSRFRLRGKGTGSPECSTSYPRRKTIYTKEYLTKPCGYTWCTDEIGSYALDLSDSSAQNCRLAPGSPNPLSGKVFYQKDITIEINCTP